MSDVEKYTTTVGMEHRRQYGQFFTPPEIAGFMRNWVLDSGVKTLYDPAFGMGAFSSGHTDNTNFSASEIDSHIIEFQTRKTPVKNITLHNEDYLLSWGRKHANIICNPPYMRFQNFKNRETVSTSFERELHLRLPGHTNTASAFLLKSLSELDGTGRLAYIMPFEFLNTGYGTIVKQKIIEHRHLVSIIKLECEKEIFPEVTTSLCILLYDSAKKYETVTFHAISKIEDIANFNEIKPATIVCAHSLNPAEKWGVYFRGHKLTFDKTKMVPLSYYGHFSRGIATGANEFFVLSPSKAKSLGLQEGDCRACITKSAQIRSPYFNEGDLREMLENDAPALLFSTNGNASPAALDYIRYGQQQGFHMRFLTRHRSPWYKTEERPPAPLLMGVFSRGGYKVILNESNATTLTCYHGFHPNIFGANYVKHLFLYLFSEAGRKVTALSMRTYGDALDKFEPNDINNSHAPSPDIFDKLSSDIITQDFYSLETRNNTFENIEKTFQTIFS